MATSEKRFPFIPFLINILIPLIFGAIASSFRDQTASQWFINLERPKFHPSFPPYGILRVIISFLIGISSFLIWQKRKTIIDYQKVIVLYLSLFVLNLIWVVLFFTIHNLLLSLIAGVMLVSLCSYTIYQFYKIRKLAAAFLCIYVLWSLVLLYLTIYIFYFN